MDLDELDSFVGGLEGCRKLRKSGRAGWYVDGLLVVRPDTPGTILIRVDRIRRERLLADHPETFGVPPRWEAHDKVQADLSGDAAAIRSAITLAWNRQRRARGNSKISP